MTMSMGRAVVMVWIALLCGSCHAVYTDDAAVRLIMQLPEVRSFSEHVQAAGRTVVVRREGAAGAAHLMQFYVGESTASHTVVWQRIVVNTRTDELFIVDNVHDELLSLEQWRTLRQ